MPITSSTYKPFFIIFQVLYKKSSMLREAYLHILYDLKEDRRVNFTVKIVYQVHIFFLQSYATIALLLIKPRPRTLFWTVLWINPQPYLILSFSIIQIPSCTLFQYFRWNKSLAVSYFNILNEINCQTYLILTFSME